MAEAASNCLLCPSPLQSKDDCTDHSLTSSHVTSLCKILKISNSGVLKDSLSSTKICSTCAATLSNAEDVIVKLEELELKLAEIGELIKDTLQKSYLLTTSRARKNEAACSQRELQILLCQAARVHEPEDYIEIVPLELEDDQYEDEFNAFNADVQSRVSDYDEDSAVVTIRAHYDQQESDSGSSWGPCWSPGDQELENDDNESSASDDSSNSVDSNKNQNTLEPTSSRQLRSHAIPKQSQTISSHSTLNKFPIVQHEVFKCVYSSCKESWTRTQKLNHVTQPHEDIQVVEGTTFKCKECNTSYFKYEDLINHAKTDHMNENCSLKKFIICQYCGARYCSIRDLGLHVKRHEGNLCCDICDLTFMYKRHLRSHMRTHKSSRQLTSHAIPLQSQSISSHSTLNKFPLIQHEVLKCVYSSCKEALTRMQKLNHVTQPHEDIQVVEGTTFKCNECNASYVKYEDLINHAKTDHINENCSLKKFIICQYCGARYSRMQELGSHVKRHEGNDGVPTTTAADEGGSSDVYLCSTCGMTFSCAIERRKHTVRHYQQRRTRRSDFPCKACQEKFSDENQLNEHISSSDVCKLMIENGQAKWVCRKCGVSFDEVETRNEHQRDCMDMIKRVCPYRKCGQQFINEQILLSHLKEPHDLGDHVSAPKEFHCRDCDQIFSSHADLRSHLESEHSLDAPRSHEIALCCQYCGSFESDVNSLRNHLGSHQLTDPCTKCSLKFPNPTALEEHEQKCHSAKKPRVSEPVTTTETCLDCSESFSHKKLLLEHLKVCSAKKPADEDYCCEQCGKYFPNQKKLLLHKYTHHHVQRKNDVVCEVCQRAFPNHAQLIRHRRSHFPDEKLKCPLCPASYCRKTRLVLHIKMKHYGTGSLKCSQCDYTCAEKGQMEAHGRKHTGERPFMCDICGMKFTSAAILKTHSRYHEDRPYKCEICGHAFVFKHRYERHVRTHIMPKKPHYKILRKLQQENALREQGASVGVECDGSELN